MSKLLTVLLAALAVVLLSQEIKAHKKGLILAFVKNVTDFKVDKSHSSAYLEPLDVKGPGNDEFILWEKFNVNYSALTSEPDAFRYPFRKRVGVTKLELSFEKHVGDVRAYRLLCGPSPRYMYLVIEVPESNEPDRLIANVYGNSVIPDSN